VNCAKTRDELRSRFDNGASLRPVPDHVRACSACRAYYDRLVALEEALGALPCEAAPSLRPVRGESPWVSGGVLSHVAAAGLAAVLIAAAGLLGWFYPMPLSLGRVAPDFTLTMPRLVPSQMWGETRDAFAAAVRAVPDLVAPGMPFPPVVVWSVTGGLAVLLVLVNAVEAYRMRTVSDGGHRTERPC
jgi:predicted anti-sigma-YlaC factor YlaD